MTSAHVKNVTVQPRDPETAAVDRRRLSAGWMTPALSLPQELTEEQFVERRGSIDSPPGRRHPRTSLAPTQAAVVAAAIIMRWAPEVRRPAPISARSSAPKRVVHERRRPAAAAGGGGASDGRGNQTEWTDVYGRSMTVDAARPFNDGRSSFRAVRQSVTVLGPTTSQSLRADSSFFPRVPTATRSDVVVVGSDL